MIISSASPLNEAHMSFWPLARNLKVNHFPRDDTIYVIQLQFAKK